MATRKLVVLAASVAVLLGATLAGCTSVNDNSGDAGGGSTPDSDGKLTIAMSVGLLDDEFLSTLADYMDTQVTAQGWELLPVVSANQSADKQVNDIQNLLSQNPDVLIIHPTDSAAVVAGVALANQQGVPVYTIDTPVDGGEVVANVRADNVQAGEAAGQLLVDALQDQDCWAASNCKVLELQGRLGSAAGDDRSGGMQSVITENPQIQLTSRPTDWDAQKAADEAQNYVTANADVAGILMASELMLPGTLSTLDTAGLTAKVGEPGHVVVVGVDGTPFAFDAIRDGTYDGSVSQPLRDYVDGLLGIIQAVQIDGETLTEGDATFDGVEGTFVKIPSGLDFQLPAIPVTGENVDDDTLWANLVAQ